MEMNMTQVCDLDPMLDDIRILGAYGCILAGCYTGFARYWSESERMIPGKGDLHDYWRDILIDGDFLGPPPSYTLIRDPVLRLCHRMLAHSIAGRSQAPEKVTVTDLFYLKGLDVGSVNIPYLLARYIRRFVAGRKSGAHISRGQFAWVAMGPERQPDVVAGAPAVAKDAPVVDEGPYERNIDEVQRIENEAKNGKIRVTFDNVFTFIERHLAATWADMSASGSHLLTRYEDQTDMSADMSVRGTRWQDTSVRGVYGSVPIIGNHEAVGGVQKDYNTPRSSNMSGGVLETTKLPLPLGGYKWSTQQLFE
ncbi:hypothetical protein Tco_0637668 [Tanacetum coccineum]